MKNTGQHYLKTQQHHCYLFKYIRTLHYKLRWGSLFHSRRVEPSLPIHSNSLPKKRTLKMILNEKKITKNWQLASCSISQKPSYSVNAVLETTFFSFHNDFHNQHLKVFYFFFCDLSFIGISKSNWWLHDTFNKKAFAIPLCTHSFLNTVRILNKRTPEQKSACLKLENSGSNWFKEKLSQRKFVKFLIKLQSYLLSRVVGVLWSIIAFVRFS